MLWPFVIVNVVYSGEMEGADMFYLEMRFGYRFMDFLVLVSW